jgi:hypothetical protein
MGSVAIIGVECVKSTLPVNGAAASGFTLFCKRLSLARRRRFDTRLDTSRI